MVEIASNMERVEFVSDEYNVSTNCAKALLLTEMGITHSGIASLLSVNNSTAQGYLNELENKIGKGVTETVPKSRRYNTFPNDDRSVTVTDQDLENIFPVNKGVELSEIDPEVMSLKRQQA